MTDAMPDVVRCESYKTPMLVYYYDADRLTVYIHTRLPKLLGLVCV